MYEAGTTVASPSGVEAPDAPRLEGLDILFVTHRFPCPPKDGARIRAYHAIRHLSTRNRVTVAAPLRDDDSDDAVASLEAVCHEVLSERIGRTAARLRLAASIVQRRSASEAYFHAPALAAEVGRRLRARAFDLVVVHCSAVAPYVFVGGPPMVLDFVDMDSEKWLEFAGHKPWPLSLGYRLEGRKLQRLERRCAERFDACAVTTAAEFALLRELDERVMADWFPNGVDFDYFHFHDDGYDPDTICFVGRMDYYPNVEAVTSFADRVLPLVRRRRPLARFQIVGADPTPAVRRLADRPAIEVTGSVPDVRPYVTEAAVSVATLKVARGTQNKILEAMALGTPVVTTRAALKGVDAVAGEHILAADSAEEIVEAVVGLMDDAERRRRLALAARQRVEAAHSWPAAMQRFEALILRCLQSRPHA